MICPKCGDKVQEKFETKFWITKWYCKCGVRILTGDFGNILNVSKHNPEDMDTTIEDHKTDEFLYFCMAVNER